MKTTLSHGTRFSLVNTRDFEVSRRIEKMRNSWQGTFLEMRNRFAFDQPNDRINDERPARLFSKSETADYRLNCKGVLCGISCAQGWLVGESASRLTGCTRPLDSM